MAAYIPGKDLTANEAIFNRSVFHATQVERFSAHEVRKIIRFLNNNVYPDLMDRMLARLIRMEKKGFDRGPATTAQLNRVMTETRGILAEGYQVVVGNLKTDLIEFAMTEAAFGRTLLEGAFKGLDVSFSMPHPNLLRSVVVSRPFEGKVLEEWGRDLSRATFDRVQKAVRIGVAEGQSIPNIARRLRGPGGVLQMSRRDAEAVVRTAVNHVSNHASEETYKANEDLVSKVELIATLDARTTVICMDYDGQTFPIGEGPRPPFHFQCRTKAMPVVKSFEELGIPLKEIPPGQRAALDGKVPSTMKYPAWLQKQSRAIQDQALGKTRAALFRAGKLDVKDLVGQNNRPLSLREIYKNTGLSPKEVKDILGADRTA